MRGFLVACDGERVIGTIGVKQYGGAGLLRSLAVDPAWHGNGVGEALLQAAEESARRAGVHELWLLTTDAQAYFERRGYSPADRATAPMGLQSCTQFQTLSPAGAVCLSKPLS